jgi:tRNA C32,U32 (ribose-2'-O)-methylase TrmJ
LVNIPANPDSHLSIWRAVQVIACEIRWRETGDAATPNVPESWAKLATSAEVQRFYQHSTSDGGERVSIPKLRAC